MERLGVSRQQLHQEHLAAEPETDEEKVPLAPHLVPVVKLFSRLRSQWRMLAGGMGGLVYTGLDYSAVEPVMRLTACTTSKPERLFDQLRTMEIAALQVLNEPRMG